MVERKIHWVSRSSDKKIGKVLASYSPKESCPDSCTLKEGGCYAWGLFYLRKLSNDIKSGLRKKTLFEALQDRHGSCRIVRHRVAGDVVGDQQSTYDECIVVEEEGLINVGYTHDWRTPETQLLKRFFRASCQNIDEVIEARSMGWATTIIVPEGTDNRITLENGEVAIMCPVVREEKKIKELVSKMDNLTKREKIIKISELKKEIKINCNSCTLCKVNQKTINKTVMFEVHGSPNTLKKINSKIG